MNREDLEKLLSKYIAVWIWSILFGANSALIYTLVNYRADKWGIYGLTIATLATLSMICVFFSFSVLLRYLYQFLIPAVFNFESTEEQTNNKNLHYLLVKACRYLIIAAVARALAALAEMFFMSLQGF